YPAAKHLWRASTVDWLRLVYRRRQRGVRTLHGRLLLLQISPPKATPTTVTHRNSAQAPRGEPSGTTSVPYAAWHSNAYWPPSAVPSAMRWWRWSRRALCNPAPSSPPHANYALPPSPVRWASC